MIFFLKRMLVVTMALCSMASAGAWQATPPVLVIASSPGFGGYTAEILKTEGINSFEVLPPAQMQSLNKYTVVILTYMDVSDEQAKILSRYVHNGGRLIAFRPGKVLSKVFGIRFEETPVEAGYMKIDTTTDIGRGLTPSRFRIHGQADRSILSGARAAGTFFTNAGDPGGYPAVVTNNYGKGQAVAFLYDLPRCIVLTRQGNPEFAGREMDGITGIRAMDLFTDGWIDTANNILNHADEQMRLLTHAIENQGHRSMPVPRFWYFPDTLKCVVTLNNDGEDSKEESFEPQFRDVHAKGAKMTLYVKEVDLISEEWTTKWRARGFEISGHPDHTLHATSPRWSAMDSIYKSLTAKLKKAYGVDKMHTVTNHWFVWCGIYPDGRADFAAQAKLEEINGIGLDCNYAHYDNQSNQGAFLGAHGALQGNYTGSGLVMKFASGTGETIPVFQQLNNVYDQQYMEHNDQEGFFDCFRGLMDRSLTGGVYSFISVRAHNNEYFFSKVPLMKMLDYANSKKIPVWTEYNLLQFLQARDAATFSGITWRGGRLSFTINASLQHDSGLSCMLPLEYGGRKLKTVRVNGGEKNYSVHRVKGVEYAFVTVKPGKKYFVAAEYSGAR